MNLVVEKAVKLCANNLLPGMHVATADIEKAVVNATVCEFQFRADPVGGVPGINGGRKTEFFEEGDGIGVSRAFTGSGSDCADFRPGRRQHLAHRAGGTCRTAGWILRQLRQNQQQTRSAKIHVPDFTLRPKPWS